MDGLIPANIILYLMLTVCIVLVIVDIIEILKLQNIWNLKSTVDTKFYQTCIKPDLLVKTAFSSFSLLAAISACLLVGLMIISMNYFLMFFLNCFLYLNYMIFGLYMLAMTIFGMLHWNDVAYICDTKTGKRIYSIGNIFSLIGCFILSLIITLGVNIYETLELYSNSILRRDDGSDILRNLFWKTVFNGRNEYLNHITGARRVRLMNPVLINHNLNDVNNQGNNNINNENNNNNIDNENKNNNIIDNNNNDENERLILDESN